MTAPGHRSERHLVLAGDGHELVVPFTLADEFALGATRPGTAP